MFEIVKLLEQLFSTIESDQIYVFNDLKNLNIIHFFFSKKYPQNILEKEVFKSSYFFSKQKKLPITKIPIPVKFHNEHKISLLK